MLNTARPLPSAVRPRLECGAGCPRSKRLITGATSLAAAVMLLASTAACSHNPFGSSPVGADDLVVVNETGRTIYVFAVDEETVTLIDPVPCIDPSDTTLLAVGAGEEASLPEVEGYEPGETVYVFIYAELEGELAEHCGSFGTAPLVRIQSATDEELRETGGRIRVTKLSHD